MTKKNSYDFFSNRECQYYPCHEKADPNEFNCLFCYCPLYALGDKCGGNFGYTPSGVKDCSSCLLPHQEGGYKYVNDHFGQIKALSEKKIPG